MNTAQTDSRSALTPPQSLKSRWFRLSLLKQFVLIGSVVLLAGMLVIGFWVSEQIKSGVLKNTAASTALFMRSFIEPAVQELATGDRLNPDSVRLLNQLLTQTDFSERVIAVKIWKEDGLVSFSSQPELIGQRFAETEHLRQAWQGGVSAEFDSAGHHAVTHADATLVEIYSPLRENGTGRIIAVAEFYERAEPLKAQLFRSTLTSWLVVGAVTLTMLAALSGIVLRGNRTIKQQRFALERQVAHLSTLLNQNKELHQRLQRASYRTTEINERYLRRISADLHDGPAQLLAYALLRLDSLKKRFAEGNNGSDQELDLVRTSLCDALGEIRTLCNGLTLPELQDLSVEALLRDVIGAHERRTGTQVTLDLETPPAQLSHPLKIGLYRFIQETLNNAFRHAQGNGQKVSLRCQNNRLEVEVADSGAGFTTDTQPSADHGLGLPGLRERIESLGGTVDIFSKPGEGTRVLMCCDITSPREE